MKAVALGAAGFLGVVSIKAEDMGPFMICAVITFIVSFAAAFAYGRYLAQRNGSIDPDDVGTAVETGTDAAPVVTTEVAAENALPVMRK